LTNKGIVVASSVKNDNRPWGKIQKSGCCEIVALRLTENQGKKKRGVE